MITLYTNRDTVIQIHKTEATISDELCVIEFSSKQRNLITKVQAEVKELRNCYLISFTDSIDVGSTRAHMRILDTITNDTVFRSVIDIKIKK